MPSTQCDTKGEDSCHLWSHTWVCSLISRSDQFEAIHSLSAGFTPYLVWPTQKKHPAAKDNILIDLRHERKSFDIWVNSDPRRVCFFFGSSLGLLRQMIQSPLLQSPLLSVLILAMTLKSAMVFAIHGTLFKPPLLPGISSKLEYLTRLCY